jgi:hypothetical protein
LIGEKTEVKQLVRLFVKKMWEEKLSPTYSGSGTWATGKSLYSRKIFLPRYEWSS